MNLEVSLAVVMLLSFGLLALFPWLARAATARWQTWRLYRPWNRPRRFDRNLIVIGAGAAGLVTAIAGLRRLRLRAGRPGV